jgi:hypothetical protein
LFFAREQQPISSLCDLPPPLLAHITHFALAGYLLLLLQPLAYIFPAGNFSRLPLAIVGHSRTSGFIVIFEHLVIGCLHSGKVEVRFGLMPLCRNWMAFIAQRFRCTHTYTKGKYSTDRLVN